MAHPNVVRTLSWASAMLLGSTRQIHTMEAVSAAGSGAQLFTQAVSLRVALRFVREDKKEPGCEDKKEPGCENKKEPGCEDKKEPGCARGASTSYVAWRRRQFAQAARHNHSASTVHGAAVIDSLQVLLLGLHGHGPLSRACAQAWQGAPNDPHRGLGGLRVKTSASVLHRPKASGRRA
jgi:hypothetical protein